MGQIGQRDKVRLRSGAHVSRSIIVRPERMSPEKIEVKTAVPIASFFSGFDVDVVHAELVGREYGTSLRLQDRVTKQWHVVTLEKSPLLDAVGRRLSHYVDKLFAAILGLALLVGLIFLFGYFMDYVGIPIIRGLSGAASGISTGVANSRLLSTLLAIALIAVIVIVVGFLLAIGWKVAGRVLKK